MKYSSISQALREAIKLYLNNKKYEDVLAKHKELQAKNPINTTTEEVRIIREDMDQ